MLATDGTVTYVMFHYGDIQWSRDPTTIGFTAGEGRPSFNLPQSFTDQTLEDLGSNSNVGTPGAYYFRLDQDTVILPSSNDH